MTERSTLCLRNRQRARKVDLPLLRRIARAGLALVGPGRPFALCLHLVPAPEMAQVNERYLQHIGPTDVITFNHDETTAATAPGSPLRGEIFICVEVAVAQAKEFKTTPADELVRYVVHGLLHLCGYDDVPSIDRARMKVEEERALKLLRKEFVLSGLLTMPKVAR